MAGLQQRSGGYRIIFRYHGKQHTLPLGKIASKEANAKAAQVEYLLMRLKQWFAEVPSGVDIVTFLHFDGKPPTRDNGSPVASSTKLTLGDFRDRYLTTHSESLEPRTLDTLRLHFKHLCAVLGEGFPLGEIQLSDLQRYVDRRAKSAGRNGKRLSVTTIREEVVSLRKAWNWGVKTKLVSGRYPYDGLCYPKTDEKPPFQTIQEIERRIATGGLTAHEKRELWESLYLQTDELASLLTFVKEDGHHPWIFPLVCMAAHTGARRSELLRMQVADVDFEGGTVLIRERKRVKGKRSTRRAPLTPLLREALQAWLTVHPGGPTLFCHTGQVSRSKKRSRTTGHSHGENRPTTLNGRQKTIRVRTDAHPPAPLTTSECHHHVKRVLRQSAKWSVVRGLHVFRHSMISCLAAAGVDQRIIDDIVGHTTEEMRRRYRHLSPQLKSQAVIAVFGSTAGT
jgi:integrase